MSSGNLLDMRTSKLAGLSKWKCDLQTFTISTTTREISDVMTLNLENLIKPKEAGKGKVICKCYKAASSAKAPLLHCYIIFVAHSRSVVLDIPIFRLSVKVIHVLQDFLQSHLNVFTLYIKY